MADVRLEVVVPEPLREQVGEPVEMRGDPPEFVRGVAHREEGPVCGDDMHPRAPRLPERSGDAAEDGLRPAEHHPGDQEEDAPRPIFLRG